MPGEQHRFTPQAERVLAVTQEQAKRLQHRFIGPEHLLIAILLEEERLGGGVLYKLGLDSERVTALVERKTRRRKPVQSVEPKLSTGIKDILKVAARHARHRTQRMSGAEDLLWALASCTDRMVMDILAAMNVTPDEIRAVTNRILEAKDIPPHFVDVESPSNLNYLSIPYSRIERGGERRPVWRVRFDVISLPGERFGLDINGDIVLGRGWDSANMVDLTPYDAESYGVSRHHLILRPTLQNLFAMDAGSTNGTLRNGQFMAVKTPYLLKSGDILTLGRLRLQLIIGGDSEAEPALVPA